MGCLWHVGESRVKCWWHVGDTLMECRWMLVKHRQIVCRMLSKHRRRVRLKNVGGMSMVQWVFEWNINQIFVVCL
jgi:hypothetical protein